MRASLSLLTPWVLLALCLVWIGWDRSRAAVVEPITLGADDRSALGSQDAPGPIATDPVCGMEVRRSTARRLHDRGIEVHFCSAFCVEEFRRNPTRWIHAPPREGHLMRGVPLGGIQLGVAGLLLFSFVWIGRGGRTREGARVEVSIRPVRALLRWRWTVPLLRIGLVAVFLGTVTAGLIGDQNPSLNIAPTLTWTIWWVGLVFLVLFFGKAWCTVCPWDAISSWVERGRLSTPRRGGVGLGLPWPRRARNIWPAVVLFLVLTWLEIGLQVTQIPRATALLGLILLALATGSALVFHRKSFCRYGCLVGRISGLYSLFSPLEVRARSREVCARCTTADCLRGNEHGDGCPTFEFPRTMQRNTYCILCTECFKTCPHDNIALRLRPWGEDLRDARVARRDEAWLALILLAMTSFHGLTMTPVWGHLRYRFESMLGVSGAISFSFLMLLAILLPIAGFAAVIWIARVWAGRRQIGRIFLPYAYTLLPIALFYHLAHNAEHLLLEGPRIVALASDPLGYGWNLFGTSGMVLPPLVTLEGLWVIQVALVLIGHLYSLWVADRTSRRWVADGAARWRVQVPMLGVMILFSVGSLWLLHLPMEMRVSSM